LILASTRYVPHVAVLLALTAVLTLLQARDDHRDDDCANPAALFPVRAAPYDDEHDEKAEKRRRTNQVAAGESGRWDEGSVELSPGLRLNYTIVRTFEPRRIYHQPGRNLATDVRTRREGIEHLDDGTRPVAIHRLHIETARRAGEGQIVAAYLLVHRGEAVVNPILAQLRGAPFELVSGRRPMTRYLVFARVPPARRAEAEEATRAWLLDAWRRHQAACGGD
jgi:hypothetical protein